jgi:hypothetical protein
VSKNVDLSKVRPDLGLHGLKVGKTLLQGAWFLSAGDAIRFVQHIEPRAGSQLAVVPVKIVEDTSTAKAKAPR